MNNLTQEQRDAKQALLDNQQDKVLTRYENADTGERNAIIRQIDSFLEIVPEDAENFWLKFREKLERFNQ